MADAAASTETPTPVPEAVLPPGGPAEVLSCPGCKREFSASRKDREGNCPHCNAPLAFLSEKEYEALLEAEDRKRAYQQRLAERRLAEKELEGATPSPSLTSRLKRTPKADEPAVDATPTQTAPTPEAAAAPPVETPKRRFGLFGKKAPEPEANPPASVTSPWREKDRPVVDIEGVGETYSQKLLEAGITTIQQLEAADAPTISTKTGAPEATVRQWQAMAELIDVDGVGPQVAELLVKSGITSIPQLARADPKELAARVASTQASRGTTIQGGPAGEKSAKKWVKAATQHPLADQPERRPSSPESIFASTPAAPEPEPVAEAPKGKRGKKAPKVEPTPEPTPVVEVPSPAPEPAAPESTPSEPKRGFFSRFSKKTKPEEPAPVAPLPVEPIVVAPEPTPEAPKRGKKGKAKAEPAPAVEAPAAPVDAVVEASIDFGGTEINTVAPAAAEPLKAEKKGWFSRKPKEPAAPEAPAAVVEMGGIDFGTTIEASVPAEPAPASKKKPAKKQRKA